MCLLISAQWPLQANPAAGWSGTILFVQLQSYQFNHVDAHLQPSLRSADKQGVSWKLLSPGQSAYLLLLTDVEGNCRSMSRCPCCCHDRWIPCTRRSVTNTAPYFCSVSNCPTKLFQIAFILSHYHTACIASRGFVHLKLQLSCAGLLSLISRKYWEEQLY